MNGAADLQSAISGALNAAADPAISFLGLGVDVVKIDRYRRDRKRWGIAYLQKMFTAEEMDYCNARKNSDICFAGTFAAKEAVFKALAMEWPGAIPWLWVDIQRDSKRRPSAVIDEQLFAQRDELRGATIAVSISHAGEYAAAVALLTRG